VADTDAGSDTADDRPPVPVAKRVTPSKRATNRNESPSAPAGGIVIPVEPTPTLRATIAHAVEAAIDEGFSTIHLVEIASWRNGDPGADDRAAAAERVLERAEAWATSDLDDVDGERP